MGVSLFYCSQTQNTSTDRANLPDSTDFDHCLVDWCIWFMWPLYCSWSFHLPSSSAEKFCLSFFNSKNEGRCCWTVWWTTFWKPIRARPCISCLQSESHMIRWGEPQFYYHLWLGIRLPNFLCSSSSPQLSHSTSWTRWMSVWPNRPVDCPRSPCWGTWSANSRPGSTKSPDTLCCCHCLNVWR